MKKTKGDRNVVQKVSNASPAMLGLSSKAQRIVYVHSVCVGELENNTLP